MSIPVACALKNGERPWPPPVCLLHTHVALPPHPREHLARVTPTIFSWDSAAAFDCSALCRRLRRRRHSTSRWRLILCLRRRSVDTRRCRVLDRHNTYRRSAKEVCSDPEHADQCRKNGDSLTKKTPPVTRRSRTRSGR